MQESIDYTHIINQQDYYLELGDSTFFPYIFRDHIQDLYMLPTLQGMLDKVIELICLADDELICVMFSTRNNIPRFYIIRFKKEVSELLSYVLAKTPPRSFLEVGICAFRGVIGFYESFIINSDLESKSATATVIGNTKLILKNNFLSFLKGKSIWQD